MRSALDVHRELLAADVPHEIVRLHTRIADADELPTALELPTGCVAVRLYEVTRRRGAGPRWAAVLVPAGVVPHPADLLAALDADAVRAAADEETNAVTGFPAGLVSPAALPPDVEVLADTALGATDVVYTAAGEGGVALGIRTRDLLVAARARAAALTARTTAVPVARYADIVDLPGTAMVDLDVGPDHGERAARRAPAPRQRPADGR